MKTIWKMDVLQDLISFYGKGIVPQYVDQKNCDAIWVLNQKCNTNHKISYDKARYTDIKHKPVSQERYLRIGDIIINATGYGTAGRVAQVDNLIGDTTVDSHMIIIRANYNKVHPKYLAYYMKHNQATIESYAEGSTGQTEISKNRLCYEFKVRYPDLETQKKIAKVLSALDDKIELNNQINKNLEEQANALFERQFINNDNLPANWTQGSLLDIADYLNGLAMQNFRPSDNEIGLPVLKIKELRQGLCDDNSELCSPSIKSEYIVHDGDVIFSWSGSLLVDLWCGGTCGLNQHLFKVTSNKYDKWYYYLWTKHHLKHFIGVAADKATTMGHIKRGDLLNAKVLIPSESDYKSMSSIFKPIIEKIVTNRIENRRLALIRDAILPKLMSGEIDVDNVEI